LIWKFKEMPKLKTKKALKKRLKLTKTGKIKRYRPGRRHLMSCKSGNRVRKLRRPALVSSCETRKYTQLLSPGR